MELQPGNLQYLPALRPGHNTSITTSLSSQYNIQSEKISASTVSVTEAMYFVSSFPLLVLLKLHHFIDFIFTFPSELKCWNSSHSALTLVGAVNQTEDTLKISNISIFKYFPSQNTLQTVKFDFQSGKYFLPRDLERLA